MPTTAIISVLEEWRDEINFTLLNNNSLYIALISADRELLFANNSMSDLINGEPDNNFINPTIEKLLLLENSVPLIFEGFLTLGDNISVNTSIWAQIYRKANHLLVVGGVDAAQLLAQNKTMHRLNREIGNLQRELIKEKSKLEKTMEQLNQANNELNELNASKDRFISILAHDLKNPIGSIVSFVDLFEKNVRQYSMDKIENRIKIIGESAENAYKLLDGTLTWARAQSGKMPFNPEKLSLANVYDEVFENLKLAALNKNIIINKIALSEIHFIADKDMMITVLRNLISNAIKFTNKGGIINVHAEQNKSTVIITVTDSGIGIEPGKLSKLFDISHKITSVGTANEEGTGLGLLLCKEFVEKHNGKIWVESQEGKGSSFKFTIPKTT